MKTLNECRVLFARETLYEAIATVRTTAFRFLVRAQNLATNEIKIFIVDARLNTIKPI